MTSIDDVMIEITPQVLLKAYACGIFPMAESAEDNALYWIEPERRGILPLDRVHVPKRLARTIRQGGFEVKVDNDFEAVIEGCAAPRSGRRTHLDQWAHPEPLSRAVRARPLPHDRGLAGRRAGRRALRRASRPRVLRREHVLAERATRARSRSSISIARLKYGGFTLLDTQFVTGHLARFGAIEVCRDEFQRLLEAALGGDVPRAAALFGWRSAAASAGGSGSAAGGGWRRRRGAARQPAGAAARQAPSHCCRRAWRPRASCSS